MKHKHRTHVLSTDNVRFRESLYQSKQGPRESRDKVIEHQGIIDNPVRVYLAREQAYQASQTRRMRGGEVEWRRIWLEVSPYPLPWGGRRGR